MNQSSGFPGDSRTSRRGNIFRVCKLPRSITQSCNYVYSNPISLNQKLNFSNIYITPAVNFCEKESRIHGLNCYKHMLRITNVPPLI